MKIKRFNESNYEDEDDFKYLKECFIEFFDNDIYKTDYELDDASIILYISFPSREYKDINDLVEYNNRMNEILLDIKVSINRFIGKFDYNYSDSICSNSAELEPHDKVKNEIDADYVVIEFEPKK